MKPWQKLLLFAVPGLLLLLWVTRRSSAGTSQAFSANSGAAPGFSPVLSSADIGLSSNPAIAALQLPPFGQTTWDNGQAILSPTDAVAAWLWRINNPMSARGNKTISSTSVG